MLGYILHGIANPVGRLWMATSSQSWRHLPTPSDAPLVHAPGSDSDRVLLVGSGVAVGYGVMSHDLALGGHLARALSAHTGRGASVDILGRRDMSPSNTSAYLASLDLARFDALVLMLGGLEGFTLMPPTLWRRQLRQLLVDLQAMAPASLKIFAVEIGTPLLGGIPRGYRSLIAHHVARLNAETRSLCGEFDGVTFVAFAPAHGDVSTLTGRTTYQGWAELIAPVVADVLDGEVRTRASLSIDEHARSAAIDSLDLDAPNPELDAIVETARDLFGATGASVTIIDHDLQRTRAAVGMPRHPIPRTEAICDLTIRGTGVFVVEDITTDARLADSMWADGTLARFYAGYPVESPDGQRIGALCIVDSTPRTFSDTDAALLRQLALRVQSALWGTRVFR